MRLSILFVTAVLISGCADEGPQTIIAYPAPAHYETRVEVHPETRVMPQPEARQVSAEPPARVTRSDIVVTTSRDIGRPTEVVGIVDTHEPSGRQDVAFSSLRERAAAIGADAVVGVEFHHGEGEGKDEPTHFSGLAVRFRNRLP